MAEVNRNETSPEYWEAILKKDGLGNESPSHRYNKHNISLDALTEEAVEHKAFLHAPSIDDLLILKEEDGKQENALYKAMEKLTSKQRLVIHLIYWENLKECDVAKRLGCSQQNISDIRDRAIEKLRRLLTK